MTDSIDYALPLKRTHLSLPYFARIMGLNPVHFAGGYGDEVYPIASSCTDVWPRYSWQQADRASHDELARAIYSAERDIARELGYQVAPTWIEDEVHVYPRPYRRDVYNLNMRNPRSQGKTVSLKNGKFIQGGTRAVSDRLSPSSLAPGFELVYSISVAGGTFVDTATITIATTLTDVSEVKAYFYDMGGAQEWEIRPCRSKSIDSGTLTMVFDAWLFIDPDLVSLPPTTAGYEPLNLDTTASYVTQVDVYREYNDYTQPGVVLYWSQQPPTQCDQCAGTGCPDCYWTTQDGCIHVRDTDLGMVVVIPACYNASTGYWERENQAVSRDPDQTMLYYYAGEQSNEWMMSRTYEPLDNYLAMAIAWMATARLERPACGCGQPAALMEELRRDMTIIGTADGDSRFVPEDAINNPFGSRVGEWRAWQHISKMLSSVMVGVAV